MTGLRWRPLDISKKLFQNVNAAILPAGFSVLENAYITETGGHQRFPVLKTFTTLSSGGIVYPYEWRGQLVCATSTGKVFIVAPDGTEREIAGTPLAGGRRVVFAETEDRLLMAAGDQIIQFDGDELSVLSKDAPSRVTHIAYLGGFVVANDLGTQLFFHNETAGDYDTWRALDVFAADRDPDTINSLIGNDFNELIIGGEHSIEQHELGINSIFSFRFRISGSVFAPYTLVFTNNAAWALASNREFIRISGQSTKPFSEDIARTLEAVDDWTDAWAHPVAVDGQDFIILQAPLATNPDGNAGLTFLMDVRNDRWSNLYVQGTSGLRDIWPGYSYAYHDRLNRRFVGSDQGVLYEMTTTFSDAAKVQKVRGRSAPYAPGFVAIENVRMRVERGVGAADANPIIRFRAHRDGRPSRWVQRSLGGAGVHAPYIEFGGFGSGSAFEFEWEYSEPTALNIRALEAQVTRAD